MGIQWQIQLFGGLRAEQNGRVVTRFRTQKTAALLAYLAYHHDASHPRPVLTELLWPECEVELARHNLSVALNALRDQLEPPGVVRGTVLVADRFSVGLNPEAVSTDVSEFEAALEVARRATSVGERIGVLTRAVELYRGPLLPGHYESWIVPEQQRLDDAVFGALRQLAGLLAEAGELEQGLQHARRAVNLDPLREEAHVELMRLQVAAGQPTAALRQYRELERLLEKELDTTPGPAARSLVAEIHRRGAEIAEEAGGKEGEEALSAANLAGGAPGRSADPAPLMEPVGGAVPLDSPFYVVRHADAEFSSAIQRRDSIVLVKGPREVGKTSLLARGLQLARQDGARVILTDFELFNAEQLRSVEALLLALAQNIADQLDLEASPADVWDARRGANPNFRRFLQREVLAAVPEPIVWGLDEVDRLFECDFGSEVFALFRYWHNERALDPTGPWRRLTLAMAYATEAHLFIKDLNKSPFNVGTRLTLDDFTPEQVADLNRRYGTPVADPGELERFYRLVGGHPYLVRRALHEMAGRGIRLTELEARMESGEWIFGDHLQRMRLLLARDLELCDVVRSLLRGKSCPTPDAFYRLRSAGIVTGETPGGARLRCLLYAKDLQRQLP